jgi:arylamine N-acetyltransferase
MPDRFDRYLRHLGCNLQPPSQEALNTLVAAHITRVPFENVSKLLLFGLERRGRMSTMEEFLGGLEHHDLGGTCYTCNPFFTELLQHLGYEAELRSADMNTPHVHSSIRVFLEGREYHVDVGNAAPFLNAVPLDRLPYEFSRGEMKWIFGQSEDGRLRCTVLNRGERVHGYLVNEQRHSYEFFRDIIVDSFQPGRTFMSLLRLVRIFPDHTVELKDRTLRIHRGTITTEHIINNVEELRTFVNTQFRMPRCPVEQALEILQSVTGPDIFPDTTARSLYA